MKSNFSLLIICIVTLFVINTQVKSMDTRNAVDNESSLEVYLRQIGHFILQKSGDSISLVLPITNPQKNVYEIHFNKRLTIDPDTLVDVVMKTLKSFSVQLQYVLNVKQCEINENVYAFEVLLDEDKNVIPCLGRVLPEDCYYLQLEFKVEDQSEIKDKNVYLIIIVGILMVSVYIFSQFKKRKRDRNSINLNELVCDNKVEIGQSVYCPEKQVLFAFGKEELLTSREHQVFMLLFTHLNEVVDRNELQKQIWEDEGLVVGRSLDVFISKLRKKISIDPALKIMNIHGRGYKLTVYN